MYLTLEGVQVPNKSLVVVLIALVVQYSIFLEVGEVVSCGTPCVVTPLSLTRTHFEFGKPRPRSHRVFVSSEFKMHSSPHLHGLRCDRANESSTAGSPQCWCHRPAALPSCATHATAAHLVSMPDC